MRLFDNLSDSPIDTVDVTGQPGMDQQQVYQPQQPQPQQFQPQQQLDTYRDVRIEPAGPSIATDVRKPTSIMERMRNLTAEIMQGLVTEREPGNYTTSPLYGIGRTIQAVGEGVQGRGGEFLAREGHLQESIRQGIANRALQQRQQKLHEQEFAQRRSEHFLGLLDKMDVDDDTKTKALQGYMRNEPGLAEMFPGVDVSQLRVAGKELEYKNHQVGEGEINDPRTGKPLPAGRYNLKGRMKNGQFVPSKIEPSTDAEIGKIDTDKYEPASLEKFKRSNNYGDLIPRDRADKLALTADTREVLGGMGVDHRDATPAQIKQARGSVLQERIQVAGAQAGATATARENTPTAQTDRQVKALERRRKEILDSSPLKSLGRPGKQHQAEFDSIDAELGRLRGTAGGQSIAPLATGGAHPVRVAPQATAPGMSAPIPVRPAPTTRQPRPTAQLSADELKALPDPKGLTEGQTAGGGRYIVRGGRWTRQQ